MPNKGRGVTKIMIYITLYKSLRRDFIVSWEIKVEGETSKNEIKLYYNLESIMNKLEKSQAIVKLILVVKELTKNCSQHQTLRTIYTVMFIISCLDISVHRLQRKGLNKYNAQ